MQRFGINLYFKKIPEYGMKEKENKKDQEKYMQKMWDFPGGPMVKTPCFQCKQSKFDA